MNTHTHARTGGGGGTGSVVTLRAPKCAARERKAETAGRRRDSSDPLGGVPRLPSQIRVDAFDRAFTRRHRRGWAFIASLRRRRTPIRASCRPRHTRAQLLLVNQPSTVIVHYQAKRRRYASFWMCDIDPLNSCRLCRQATHWKNLAAGAKGKNQRWQGGGAFAPTTCAANLDSMGRTSSHARVGAGLAARTTTRSQMPKPGVRCARSRESRGRVGPSASDRVDAGVPPDGARRDAL